MKVLILLLLLTVFTQADNINLDNTHDSTNIKKPSFIDEEKEMFKPSLAHKLNPMAYRPAAMLIALPIGVLSGAAVNTDITPMAIGALLSLPIGYYIGKNGLTENFIFEGSVGLSYSITSNNFGLNTTIFNGFESCENWRLGFELGLLTINKISEIEYTGNRTDWSNTESVDSEDENQEYNYSIKEKSIELNIYTPIVIGYNVHLNEMSNMLIHVGFGYFNKVFETERTREFTMIEKVEKLEEVEGSDPNIETDGFPLNNKMIHAVHLSLAYKLNSHIIKSRFMRHDISIISLEYGRSFK